MTVLYENRLQGSSDFSHLEIDRGEITQNLINLRLYENRIKRLREKLIRKRNKANNLGRKDWAKAITGRIARINYRLSVPLYTSRKSYVNPGDQEFNYRVGKSVRQPRKKSTTPNTIIPSPDGD